MTKLKGVYEALRIHVNAITGRDPFHGKEMQNKCTDAFDQTDRLL